VKEQHGHRISGQPTYLYWIHDDQAPYVLQVSEVEGHLADYELTILAEPLPEPEQTALTCDAYSVDIDVQENGDLLVEERFAIQSADGELHQVQRVLPLDSTEGIEHIALWVGDTEYRMDTTSADEMLSITEQTDSYTLSWQHSGPVDEPRTYTLRFSVLAGARRPEGGCSQFADDVARRWGPPTHHHKCKLLSWQAIPFPRDFPIQDGMVVVRLPSEQIVYRFIAFGAQGVATAYGQRLHMVTREITFDLERPLSTEQGMDVEVVYLPE
jgi:hypothetical protein